MQTIETEIKALHDFFVDWFTEAIPETYFDQGFSARFDSEFILIPPADKLLKLEDLSAGARSVYASNPDFKIAIRNIKIRRLMQRHVLVTYEE